MLSCEHIQSRFIDSNSIKCMSGASRWQGRVAATVFEIIVYMLTEKWPIHFSHVKKSKSLQE